MSKTCLQFESNPSLSTSRHSEENALAKSVHESKYFFLILAGIHHLALDQNHLVLRKDLILEHIMEKMLKEDPDMEQNLSSVEKKEDRIQKFIEWLQWRPLQDYKEFLNLLDTTQQTSLMECLAASCKFKICNSKDY